MIEQQKYQHTKFPQQLIIESTAACNQRCINCGRTYMERKCGNMDINLYKKIVDEVGKENPYTEIWPTFMGESMLLGDKIFNMINYAKQKGCKKVTLNTNGTLINKNINGIIKSGMDRLIVSCDAHTPETHKKVRPGIGKYNSLETIYRGVNLLINEVQKSKLEKLLIEMQFSIFDENKHEKDDFIKYWLDKGVVVKVRPKLYWTGEVKGGESRIVIDDSRTPCLWVLDSCGIHWNGDFVMCAVDAEGKEVLGNLYNNTIKEIWDSSHKKIRELHLQKRFNDLPQICKECPDWKVKKAKAYFSNKEVEKAYIDYIREGRIFMEHIPKTEEDIKIK